MADGIRVWVSLPDRLVSQLDHVAREMGTSRDDALRRAVESFVGRTRAAGLGEAMARGYQAMAKLNLSLAEEGGALLADGADFDGGRSEAGERGDS